MRTRIYAAIITTCILVSIVFGVTLKVPNGTTGYSIYPTVREPLGAIPNDYNNAPVVTNMTLHYTTPDGNAAVDVSLTALATYSTAWSSGKACASGKNDGVLRICIPDACLNEGVGKKCIITVTSTDDRVEKYTIILDNIDPNGNTLAKVQNVSSGANVATSTDLQSYIASGAGTIASGTAQAGTANTIQLASATNASTILTGCTIVTTKSGAIQMATIQGYAGATDTATIYGTWPSYTPDSSTTYAVHPNPYDFLSLIKTAISLIRP
jgi:hypothetical protein